jgi:hypothetical protein
LEKKQNNKSKRLRIVDFTRDGKGISKSAADMKPGLKRFFVTIKNNFGKLVSVNIFMVLGNFPLLFLIINFSGYFKTPYFLPMSDLFQNIAAHLSLTDPTPFNMVLFSIEGLQAQVLAPTLVTYIFYGIGALILLTFGIVNVGTAYILRNLVSGEPVFPWHDFWYAVKRNYKQAIPVGILDVIICSILFLNIYFTMSGTSDFLVSVMFWCSVVISVMYFFMRYYVYVQIVTFKLSVFKIIKNSLIFALIGFKRNIVACCSGNCVLFYRINKIKKGGKSLPLIIITPILPVFSVSDV